MVPTHGLDQIAWSNLGRTKYARRVSHRDVANQPKSTIPKRCISVKIYENLVPTHGLEPRTYALQVRCTTNCATSASTLFYVVNRDAIVCIATSECNSFALALRQISPRIFICHSSKRSYRFCLIPRNRHIQPDQFSNPILRFFFNA